MIKDKINQIKYNRLSELEKEVIIWTDNMTYDYFKDKDYKEIEKDFIIHLMYVNKFEPIIEKYSSYDISYNVLTEQVRNFLFKYIKKD